MIAPEVGVVRVPYELLSVEYAVFSLPLVFAVLLGEASKSRRLEVHGSAIFTGPHISALSLIRV